MRVVVGARASRRVEPAMRAGMGEVELLNVSREEEAGEEVGTVLVRAICWPMRI